MSYLARGDPLSLSFFDSHELDENSVSSILERTADDGRRYKKKFITLLTGLWTNSDLNGLEPGPARAPNSHKLQSNPDYFSNTLPSQRAIWSIY